MPYKESICLLLAFTFGIALSYLRWHIYLSTVRGTDGFTTTKPLHYSGKRWSSRVQQTETGSDILSLLRRSCDFLDYTQLSYNTNSFDIVVVLCVFFYPPPPPPTHTHTLACSEYAGGSPAVFTHCFLLDFYGGQAKKVQKNCGACHSDIAPPPEKIRRRCGVQFMSESN